MYVLFLRLVTCSSVTVYKMGPPGVNSEVVGRILNVSYEGYTGSGNGDPSNGRLAYDEKYGILYFANAR